MADEVDRANEEAERELQSNIERARLTTASLPGQNICCQCRGPNDRKQEGWATCTSCDAEHEANARILDYADDGQGLL